MSEVVVVRGALGATVLFTQRSLRSAIDRVCTAYTTYTPKTATALLRSTCAVRKTGKCRFGLLT